MRKGFTLVEIIIGLAVISLLTVGACVSFDVFSVSSEEVALSIKSKLEYSKRMAVNRTDETAYVIFKNNKMIYTDIGKSTTDIQEQKYNNTMASSQVKITTNIPDDTILFSSQGFPIDKSGNVLKNLHIYIEKENEEIRTINISCMGNIDIVNGKDTSEDDICDLTTFTADVKDVLLCKDNEEFFQGVCVEKCKDKYLRNMAGECILQCPSDEKVEGDKCVKRCPDVKKIWDAFLGECRDFCNYEEEDLFDGSCLKKCEPNQIRDDSGTCITIGSGYTCNTVTGDCETDAYGWSYCPDMNANADDCEQAGEAVWEEVVFVSAYAPKGWTKVDIEIDGKKQTIDRSSFQKMNSYNTYKSYKMSIGRLDMAEIKSSGYSDWQGDMPLWVASETTLTFYFFDDNQPNHKVKIKAYKS